MGLHPFPEPELYPVGPEETGSDPWTDVSLKEGQGDLGRVSVRWGVYLLWGRGDRERKGPTPECRRLEVIEDPSSRSKFP